MVWMFVITFTFSGAIFQKWSWPLMKCCDYMHFKVISATTNVLLITEEVITTTLKVISATTNVMLTTEEEIYMLYIMLLNTWKKMTMRLKALTPWPPVSHIFGFSFFSSTVTTTFKHVNGTLWHESAIFENSWPLFCQIWIIFTHLKLWIASARHKFKWMKILIFWFGG